MTSEKIRSKIFYKQPYYKNKWGGFYIHFHGRDIGRIQKWVNYGDISQEFINQKENISEALVNQYTNLLLSNISVSTENISFLGELVGKDYRETFISELDVAVKEILGPQINIEVLKAAHSSNHYLYDTEELIINQGDKGIEKTIKDLNKILKIVEKVINLSKYDNNAKDLSLKIGLGAVLRNAKGAPPNLQNVGHVWINQINKIKRLQKKGFWITLKQENQLIKYLNSITAYFKQENNKDYRNLTLNTIKHIFEQNISPKGIGESFGLLIKREAMKQSNQSIEKALEELEGINKITNFPGDGGDQNTLYFSNAKGNYSDTDSQNILQGITNKDKINKGQNKTDATEEIKVKVQSKHKDKEVEIKYEVGVSDKFYLNKDMFEIEDGVEYPSDGLFELSKSLPLGAMIKSTFRTKRLQYLAYNVIAWQDDKEDGNNASNAIYALQECIFRRNIIHGMSSRSGPKKDFAAYFLINGQLLSLWDIINFALNKKDSNIGSNQTSKEKGISFYYEKSPITNIISNRLQYSMVKRIAGVNTAIDDANVIVSINPSHLV